MTNRVTKQVGGALRKRKAGLWGTGEFGCKMGKGILYKTGVRGSLFTTREASSSKNGSGSTIVEFKEGRRY